MAEISPDRLWKWWRELAEREVKLEKEYRPLVEEHGQVHRERSMLEELMSLRDANVRQQIGDQWEQLKKGEELPIIERSPTDTAYDVLYRTGSPLHYKTIFAEMAKEGTVIGGHTPENTLLVYLGRDKRFSKASERGRGYYKLKEWEK